MTVSQQHRGACRRWASLALLTLLAVTSAAPARAEDPPVFLLKWGTPGFGDGQFAQPFGLAVSPAGFVYVTDRPSNRIQKFTTDSAFVLKWGTTGSGPGQFDTVVDVTVAADGSVLATDAGNGRVQKFDANGNYLMEWRPNGATLAADPNAPLVYFAYSNRVEKYDTSGTPITTWSFGTEGTTFFQGLGVGPSGNVYVAVVSHHIVVKFSPTGTVLGQWGGFGDDDGQLRGPKDVAVDADENVYVVDRDHAHKFTSRGGFLARWGGVGSGDGQFRNPLGVAVDSDGNVYVLDHDNSRIQKFGDAPTRPVPTSWGRLKALYR